MLTTTQAMIDLRATFAAKPRPAPPAGAGRRFDEMLTTSEVIRKLQRDLAGLQRVPSGRREDELADNRAEICGAMIADLMAGRPLLPDLLTVTAAGGHECDPLAALIKRN